MHVSFRNRLTFFFILLVVLPVIAVGIVGILIVRNAEEGETTRGSTRRRRGRRLFETHKDNARRSRETFAQDDSVAAAIRDGDRDARCRSALNQLVGSGTARPLGS